MAMMMQAKASVCEAKQLQQTLRRSSTLPRRRVRSHGAAPVASAKQVTVLSDEGKKTFEVPDGTTILDAAFEAGVHMESDCQVRIIVCTLPIRGSCFLTNVWCCWLWVLRKQMGVCMTCACKVHEGEAKGYSPITSEHANVVQACHQEPATDMVIEPIKSDDDLAESIGLNFA